RSGGREHFAQGRSKRNSPKERSIMMSYAAIDFTRRRRRSVSNRRARGHESPLGAFSRTQLVRTAHVGGPITPIFLDAARNLLYRYNSLVFRAAPEGRVLLMAKSVSPELAEQWKIQDALDTYGVRQWGKGYFGINELGHVVVHPDKNPEKA